MTGPGAVAQWLASRTPNLWTRVQFPVLPYSTEVSSWPQEPFTSLLCANSLSFHKSNGDANIVILTIYHSLNCVFLPWVPDFGGNVPPPHIFTRDKPCFCHFVSIMKEQLMILNVSNIFIYVTKGHARAPLHSMTRWPRMTSKHFLLRNSGFWLVKNDQQWHSHWR